MKLLGLTGGMGMGKSAAADLLTTLNVAVIDTDTIARRIVEPGQAALADIQARFGSAVIGADGHLRRDLLAERVFSDSAARQDLEGILHPRIRAVWFAQAATWRKENRRVGVVVIPLLFETNAAESFDATICVACSMATQMERLRPRGWTAEEISRRLEAQWPVEKKVAMADFVVWTEGTLAVHAAQLQRVLGSLEQGRSPQL
jgi:dephospho-CoA kinase